MPIIKIRATGVRFDATASAAIWTLILIAFFILTIFSRQLLPDRFFADEQTILLSMSGANGFRAGDSFESTAYFFKIFGFTGGLFSSVVFSLISFMLSVWFVTSCLKRSGRREASGMELVVIIYFSFIISIFMGILGKDFLVLLLTILFWILLNKRLAGLLLWSLFVATYAYVFRAQWFIVLVLFWVIYVTLVWKPKLVPMLFVVVVCFGFLAAAFQIVFGFDLDHFRTLVNDVRLAGDVEDAKTMIQPFLNGGAIASFFNVCLVFLFLMFPVPLLMLRQPYYLLNFLIISFVFFRMLSGIARYLKNSDDKYVLPCIALIFSSVVAQSLYEPDYGSYVRHLSPLFPIIIFVCFSFERMKRRINDVN